IIPDGFAGGGFAQNVVGTGSDGTTYWNLFNIEDETDMAAVFVTYATLADMLNDENRVLSIIPDGFAGGGFAQNVVGTGSDGATYCRQSDVEDETDVAAVFVTIATLANM